VHAYYKELYSTHRFSEVPIYALVIVFIMSFLLAYGVGVGVEAGGGVVDGSGGVGFG